MRKTVAMAGIALALGATGSAAADDLAEGTAFAEQHCLSCHNREKLVELAGRTPEAERLAKWQTFLKSHHAPNEKDRSNVVAWLEELAHKP